MQVEKLIQNSEIICVEQGSHPFLSSDDSNARVKLKGHRGFVGGGSPEMWYGIGMLQYHFLVNQGLRHNQKFLDIACGSLRLGQFLIPYLNEGNYFGLDAEKELIDLAIKYEIPSSIIDLKKPSFSFNYNFDFGFIDSFDFAIAQSLFTHLNIKDISICFNKLRPKANSDSKFFFTFFEGDSSKNSKSASHANRKWEYSFVELESVAREQGWILTYIGDWNHPRSQMMILAQAF